MIIEINEEPFEEVVLFCWELARQKSNCGFPRFDNFEQLSARFLRTLQHPEDKILAYYEFGTLTGVLNLYVEAENKYLQTIGGIFTQADFSVVANQFLNYISQRYHEFELYLGFPKEYMAANQYFNAIKAEIVDASMTMKLLPTDYIKTVPTHDVISLTEADYSEFATFHDYHNPKVYWNSERIFEKIEQWNIFLCKVHDKIIGDIIIRQNLGDTEKEIYGISIDADYKNIGLELSLLTFSLQHTLTPDIEKVLFFVDETDTAQYEATLKTGFKQVDTYRCYKMKL